MVMLPEPFIQAKLHLVNAPAGFFSERCWVKPAFAGFVEPPAGAVGLRRLRLRLGTVYVFQAQVQRILAVLPIPAIPASLVG